MTNQETAFAKLSKLKVGALFMEMGTGKTKVALDLIASKQHKVDKNIWICPFSLKSEIEAEWKKWHPEISLNIYGCESIGASDRIYLEALEDIKNNRCFVVVDESLKIKNKEAKRTERILEFGKYAEYKLILNGTPLSRNVLDLWTQMQFLSPKILKMSYREFKDTYTEYYLQGTMKGRVKKQYNIEHLVSLIQPYIFESKLDIAPSKHQKDITYQMTEFEAMEYDDIKASYLNKHLVEDFTGVDFFGFAQVLQSHYTRSEKKAEKLKESIEGINGQVIIFVKYLKSIPNGKHKIIGEETPREREETKRAFIKGEFKELYITYGCGAYGLNLQNCHTVIFADHIFDYAQRIQAEARVYRMGQEHDVTYINLWCDVGLEKMIQHSLRKKTRLLDDVKKEIEKNGVNEWIKNL